MRVVRLREDGGRRRCDAIWDIDPMNPVAGCDVCRGESCRVLWSPGRSSLCSVDLGLLEAQAGDLLSHRHGSAVQRLSADRVAEADRPGWYRPVELQPKVQKAMGKKVRLLHTSIQVARR